MLKNSLFILLCLNLLSCAIVERTVSPENRISLLQNGTKSGSIAEFGYSLAYTAKSDNTNLTVNAEFTGQSFRTVEIRILLLDESGKIVKQQILYSTGYRNSYAPGSTKFSRDISLSPGIVAFTFDFYVENSTTRE